ncbi:glycosyltransferase family protein [Stutzerimonas nitrititolerans]|uniref:glycosyltransferase family protein n=1 Tax=Stutzerimonas nitrititolerans TaxID=2482751 RepID=UPI0028B043E8|nr:glycosyltransferase [Stutzerimonas nitrititolerans]
MRVLLLSSAGKALDNSPMWRALGNDVELELHFLDKAQQRDLKGWFRNIEIGRYDRIVLDLMFKYIHKQSRLLGTLPNLVLYEEDAYLNFMPGSKWLGVFSALYRKLPEARLITTGAWVARRFVAEQVDAHFVPKGFDAQRLNDRGSAERDIFLGFIGRLGSSVYARRQELLTSLAAVEPLQLMRTQRPDEYPELLNRIRCFVSADIGLKEYMAKNFEAMACGCLLIAKRQGDGEEHALGLCDGENVLLYDGLAELRQKIEWVRQNPAASLDIAVAGREWVFANNEYARLAKRIETIISRPFVTVPRAPRPWWKMW